MSAPASVRLTGEDDDETIDGFELFSARRSLELLKRRLGREALLALLHEEITAGDAFLREHPTAPPARRRSPRAVAPPPAGRR